MMPEHEEEDQNNFLFDDFFVPEDDPGHKVEVKVKDRNGRMRVVPIFLKRGMSLSDRESAKAKAVQTRINPKNGQLEMTGVDEGVFQMEILMRAIVSWPFKDKYGQAIEVTRKNINLCLPDMADILFQQVLGLMDRQEASLDFFEKASEDRS
jgi:hypothetical protein